MIVHWSKYIYSPPPNEQGGIMLLDRSGPAPPVIPAPTAIAPPRIVPVYEPSPKELAVNFAGAMARWAAGGFKVSDEAIYRQRTALCEACDRWDGSARGGLGICRVKGCGCTSLKRWLATERCPLGKW